MISISHWGLFPSVEYQDALDRYWFHRAELWRLARSTQGKLIK